MMGSWTWNLGKNLLGKIQSNLKSLNCEAWARWEQKINPKKQQRDEDSQDIVEEIIKQSELAQAVWEFFTKEEEQNQT